MRPVKSAASEEAGPYKNSENTFIYHGVRCEAHVRRPVAQSARALGRRFESAPDDIVVFYSFNDVRLLG